MDSLECHRGPWGVSEEKQGHKEGGKGSTERGNAEKEEGSRKARIHLQREPQ